MYLTFLTSIFNMIYRYELMIGWFTPYCDFITMGYVWEEMQNNFYDDKIIYVGY